MGQLFNQLNKSFFQLLADKDIKIESPEQVERVIENVLPQITNIIFKQLMDNAGEMLQEQGYLRGEFEARLHRRWMKAFNLLEMLIVMNTEIGEEFVEHPNEDEINSYKFNVLFRIHTRACQITYEILTLLKSGFPDGALARWRTLHELAVLSFFIFDNDEDLALRYLEYEGIENAREMYEYQKRCSKLGYEPLSDREINKIKSHKKQLIKKYGDEFVDEYGWTSLILPKKKRNFRGIEEQVSLQHLRPFYKMACNQIHLGPKGNAISLGLMGEKDRTNFFLCGASNYGLADPGQNAAISLVQIATCLLMFNPTIDKMVIIKSMESTREKLCHQFVDIQHQIEDEERNKERSFNIY